MTSWLPVCYLHCNRLLSSISISVQEHHLYIVQLGNVNLTPLVTGLLTSSGKLPASCQLSIYIGMFLSPEINYLFTISISNTTIISTTYICRKVQPTPLCCCLLSNCLRRSLGRCCLSWARINASIALSMHVHNIHGSYTCILNSEEQDQS